MDTFQNWKFNIQQSNGDLKNITWREQPFIYDGRTYVPLSNLVDYMGYDAKWQPEISSITLVQRGTTGGSADNYANGQGSLSSTVIFVDFLNNWQYSIMQMNGKSTNILWREQPFIYQGRTYVPLSNLVDYMGYKAVWQPETSSITLVQQGGSSTGPVSKDTKTYTNSKHGLTMQYPAEWDNYLTKSNPDRIDWQPEPMIGYGIHLTANNSVPPEDTHEPLKLNDGRIAYFQKFRPSADLITYNIELYSNGVMAEITADVTSEFDMKYDLLEYVKTLHISDWDTYKDSKHGFSFEYPTEWGTPEDADTGVLWNLPGIDQKYHYIGVFKATGPISSFSSPEWNKIKTLEGDTLYYRRFFDNNDSVRYAVAINKDGNWYEMRINVTSDFDNKYNFERMFRSFQIL